MLKVSEQAIDAFPNQPRAYLYYGIAAIAKGKYDDGAAQLEQAQLMAGNTPIGIDIQEQLAYIALLKKDLPAATIQYEALLAKGGDRNPFVLEHYGDLLAAKGKATEAATYWQKAYDLTKKPALLQKIKGQ
jgi:tetratricopeptide (TPR) repeat protein